MKKTKNIKFSEIIKEFLKFKKTRIKITTFTNYEGMQNILINAFDDKDITKIKPIEIQKFLDNFINTNSTGHARNILNFLKSVFKFACRYDYININPALNVELLPPNKKDYTEILEDKEKAEKIYSIDDLNKIFSFITISKEEEFIYYFALSTGLRMGEILSLCWCDIDFKENKITINKNLIKDSKKNFVIDSPKTLLSIRTIYLTDDLKQKLKEYKKLQDKNKFYHGKNYIKYYDKNKEENNFVFRIKNGALITPIKLQNSIRKIKQVDPFFHFHRLRHSFTSHAVNSGIDILYISRALGHSNTTTTTNIYTHIKQDKIKEVYQKINLG